MNDPANFAELLRRAQARDNAAAAELIRRYEPTVRRAIRVRLFDIRLRRVFDSMDICQSVMGNFFECLSRGKYPLETSEQLLKLLVTMAHNKLTDQVRRQQAKRRDNRQLAPLGTEVDNVAAPGPTPSRIVAAREILAQVRGRLSVDEMLLLDRRGQGHDWAEIAAETGSTPEAVRKKLSRALSRVQHDPCLAQ